MARSLTAAAEVKRGLNERSAEVPAPEVIDGDAGRQRVLGVGDPAGQGSPAARAGTRVDRGERRVNGRVGVEISATLGHTRRRIGSLFFEGLSLRRRQDDIP